MKISVHFYLATMQQTWWLKGRVITHVKVSINSFCVVIFNQVYLFDLPIISNCPKITLYQKLKNTGVDLVFFESRNILKENSYTS